MNGLFYFLDVRVFYALYGLPHTFPLLQFFSFLSGVGTWGIVWILIMGGLILWKEIGDRRELFTLTFAVILSFVTSDLILKHIFLRPRPFSGLEDPSKIFGYSSGYSFPSSHATIAFACAFILSYKHKKWDPGYYILAVLIAVSRVYLGRHFPTDIIAGAILGTIIGSSTIYIVDHFIKPLVHDSAKK